MTTLHAAGGGLPLAVHLPHIVEQIGSLAGFAAVGGLAILSALYFSQARDLRRLREWAGRAPERAAEAAERGQEVTAAAVPGRVVATPQRAPQPAQGPVPVTAPGPASTAPAAPPGAATASPPAPAANGDAPPAEGEAAKAEDAKPESDGEKPAGTETPAEGDAAKEGEGEGEGEQKQEDEDAAPEGGEQPAPGKPGMPAPASAAAAAGAGAKSISGPGVPEAKPPTRPPASVLPPRTGVSPPRRIGGTASDNRALGPSVLGPATPKPKRNPTYVALAVIGVLVLGAGAAIGVPKLVNGGSNDSKKTAAKKKHHKRAVARPPLSPSTITVSVLNGTMIPGLAAQIGDEAQNIGFNLGTTAQVAGILEGTKTQRANSVVMYVPGHARDARLVAKKLHITGAVEAADSDSRQLAGDATVIVVVGQDQTR